MRRDNVDRRGGCWSCRWNRTGYSFTHDMAGRSVFFILNVICVLFGDRGVPRALASAQSRRNLWLDCPCIYASDVNANNRGVFTVNSSNPRFSRSDCVLVFVMGATTSIVQLELKDVQLQPNCVEYVELFPYLKEPVIENTTTAEYTMCHSHFKRNASLNYAPEELNEIVPQLSSSSSLVAVGGGGRGGGASPPSQQQMLVDVSDGGDGLRQQHEQLFSSGRIYGLRVIFKPFALRLNSTTTSFVRGEYAFLDRANFENDGRLIAGTFCDYYFFAEEHREHKERHVNETNDVWKYFHSPRYPANYAAHIQCSYKFIGRPDSRVEIVFEELLMPKNQKNCNLDKVTIYDAESPNVSSIVDVICEAVHNKRILSNGPDLLVEFNASSNQTTKGFRGKFKFVDAINSRKNQHVIANPQLNEVILHRESHALPHPGIGSSSTFPQVTCISSKSNYELVGKTEDEEEEEFNKIFQLPLPASVSPSGRRRLRTQTEKEKSLEIEPIETKGCSYSITPVCRPHSSRGSTNATRVHRRRQRWERTLESFR